MFKFFKIYEKKIVGASLLFLFTLNFIIWGKVFDISQKPGLSVSFFDVGQGDSIFLESKDGTQILIDGGPNGRVLSHLGSVMQYGDDFIDAVVVSHPHADHVSGLIEVLKKYRVGTFIESGVAYDTAEIDELRRLVEDSKIERIIVDEPMRLSFFDDASLKFIFPVRSFENTKVKDVNETSLVSILEYEGRKILFTGDAGVYTEKKLMSLGVLEDVDVLKVGHQGSRFSSTRGFLESISPEFAVIMVGKNSYGHPTDETLSRLAAVGANIFRTDLNGTITLDIRNGELIWNK